MPTTYAIPNGRTVMDATTYSGTGATQTITNNDLGTVGFKPDLVWLKCRNAAGNHELSDSIRGVQKYLRSNSIIVETSDVNSLQSFNSNGFSVGIDGDINGSGETFVAWQWQAGQGTTSNNTSGSFTTTVSVNQAAGFSICTYTGNGSNPQTFGHGLSAAPSFVIVKVITGGTGSWVTYHKDLGPTKYVLLDQTIAAATDGAAWNNTSPTSSVVSIGQYCNYSNGWTYVAYCWTPIPGFSAFGSFTGNGSTDGPFIYLGFRPKFLMWKRTDSTSSWTIYDTSRSTYNTVGVYLVPDSSGIEGTYNAYDFLSNGVKLRGNDASMNANGGTYIYAAFAENPFAYANAR